MPAAAAIRQLVVETKHPAKLLVEVRQPFFCGEVVAVLWERRRTADLREIVDRFAPGESTQEIQTMTEVFLSLGLERVIGRIPTVLYGCKRPEEWVRTPRLDVSVGGHRILVQVGHNL